MQAAAAIRPQLVSPRAAPMLEAVREVTGGSFDIDAFHVMNERDNALIADEVLHGAGSSTFVYSFEIKGTPVFGVSVVGARHLANHYRGLKHRLVAAVQKSGELFTFQSYPAENMPMSVSCNIVQELADQPDFYSAIVEITDIKSGNSIQIERRENRFETDRQGREYERPNYATIAQSKAYRNAVLALIPQDVRIRFCQEMLKLNKGEKITESVLDQKRANVLRFAARNAISFDRRAVEGLTLDQISGLGDAAREGALPAFVQSAKALGLEIAVGSDAIREENASPAAEATPRRRGRPPGPSRQEPTEPARETGIAPPAESAPAGPEAEPAADEGEAEAEPEEGGSADQPTPPRRVHFEV